MCPLYFEHRSMLKHFKKYWLKIDKKYCQFNNRYTQHIQEY